MTMGQVEPLGVVVTPADCYIKAAVSATRKLLGLLGRSMVVRRWPPNRVSASWSDNWRRRRTL
jgi:hypothetical protein